MAKTKKKPVRSGRCSTAKKPAVKTKRQSSKREPLDRCTDYARQVVAGKIVAGELVRLACARHLEDLKTGVQRGLKFDLDTANDAIAFFETFLHFYEGDNAGKLFILQPFQCFIIGSIWGWKGPDGYRRFRTAYIEQGKGNGKSPLAAGIGLLGLVADGEPGAEIYAAAAVKDQAKILFRDAEQMVSASPELSEMVQKYVNNLSVEETASFFRPISSEKHGLDGKRPHIVLIDEVHEHPTSIVVDKMRAGTKGRRQALIFEITNSGFDRQSVCWHHHEYSEKVLRGVIPNDSWFAFVCGLDEGDDWRDPKCWPKANPNLGVSIPYKYLEEQVAEAIGIPSKENITKRLNFCIWTEQSERWMPIHLWDGCSLPAFTAEDLHGETCFGGLDLGSTNDFTSFCKLFPPTEDRKIWTALWRFWIPQEKFEERVRKDPGSSWAQWLAEGWLEVTPGNVTDYDYIREAIHEDAEAYVIREVVYDRWNATQLITQLGSDGMTMVPFGQGFQSMNAPMQQVMRVVSGKEFSHGGNPVARWQMSNVASKQDPAGNIKPDKEKSADKIDGVAALVDAMGRAMLSIPQGKYRPSIFSGGTVVL